MGKTSGGNNSTDATIVVDSAVKRKVLTLVDRGDNTGGVHPYGTFIFNRCGHACNQHRLASAHRISKTGKSLALE
ncbi:MAG: hypothetical protein V3U65_16800 [Granulosicoccaceae bacterium]